MPSLLDALFDAPCEVEAGGMRWRVVYRDNDALSDLKTLRLKLVRDNLDMLVGTRHQGALAIEDPVRRQLAVQAAMASIAIERREEDPESFDMLDGLCHTLACDSVTGLWDATAGIPENGGGPPGAWMELALTLDPSAESRDGSVLLATRLGPDWPKLAAAVAAFYQGGGALVKRVDSFRGGCIAGAGA